jgi:chromate transporter
LLAGAASVNLFVLYLLLLKASVTSFSGMTSLPVVRHDFVETRGVITDRQLTAAVAAGRTAPGPNGLYLVSIGYFVAGWQGSAIAWAAIITPAFLIIPMIRYLGRRADRPRVKSAIQAVTVAAAGLVIHSAIPIAREAITGWAAIAIAAASFFFLVVIKRETVWVIAGSAIAGLIVGLR